MKRKELGETRAVRGAREKIKGAGGTPALRKAYIGVALKSWRRVRSGWACCGGHSMLYPYGFIGAMDMKDRAEGTSGRRAVNSKAKRAGRDARGSRSEGENQKSRRDAGATKGDGAGLRQFSIEGRGGSLWRSTLLGRGGG